MTRLLRNIPKDRKIYGNCQVLSPNGILMFRCDDRKANWYLKKNLGEIVSKNPLVVKLNFEPNGLGNHNKEFGLSDMLNICVVCGNDSHLTKHHVVPYCYRRYFPLEVKSHNHHDVLSVCVDCHEEYERHADTLKSEISINYNAPINGEIEDYKDVIKYSKLSSTILGDTTNIPKSRIKEIRNRIKDFLGIKRLTSQRLQKMIDIKSRVIKKTHGQLVIEKVSNIQQFVEMWRRHFIDKMDPKFLPNNWKIESKL
jgi:hypothetical protein